MQPIKVDLTLSEQLPANDKGKPNPLYPSDGCCKSGHPTPSGTRFFHVSGKVLPKVFWGTYCEPCLIVANRLAAKRKQDKLGPDAEIEELLLQAERSVSDV